MPHCEWRQCIIAEATPKFPQCNPSIRTHNAWQLEPGNSKQPGWECYTAEGHLLFGMILIWQHILASSYKIMREKGKFDSPYSERKAARKPRWYYLLSKHSGTSADQHSTQCSGTHMHVHTRWTSRHRTVAWQPYIQIHSLASGLFTVQRILTCKRAWQAVLNKQS